MKIRKAQKQKSKLRIGLSSPSGGGKTYSALLIASGITVLDKVVMIDTENGSGDLYDHLGDYSVLTLQAPFSPERYIKAIEECEQAGFEVIIIDSITHEWEGSGGCLEINEQIARAKFRGNTWSAWSDTGARHQKFLNKIVQSSCHIITTVRNKTETAMEGKKVLKIGTKEITREGFEYELTVNFNIDRESHQATASKDRTGLFDSIDYFIPTKETGKTLIKWASAGKEIKKPRLTKKSLSDATEWIKGQLNAGKSNQELFKVIEKKYEIPETLKKEILEVKSFNEPPKFQNKDYLEYYKKGIAKTEKVDKLTVVGKEIQDAIKEKLFTDDQEKELMQIYSEQKTKLSALKAFELPKKVTEKEVDDAIKQAEITINH